MPYSSALPIRPSPPSGANPMSHDLPRYRAVLEEQWRRQAADLVQLSFGALTPAPHEADQHGLPLDGLDRTAYQVATARQHLNETEAALARVDDGSYGLCRCCGDPITPERLEVLPAARYCATCQGRSGPPPTTGRPS